METCNARQTLYRIPFRFSYLDLIPKAWEDFCIQLMENNCVPNLRFKNKNDGALFIHKTTAVRRGTESNTFWAFYTCTKLSSILYLVLL